MTNERLTKKLQQLAREQPFTGETAPMAPPMIVFPGGISIGLSLNK